VAQGQLARRVTWLDPIDDREMVRQSVANWTEAKVRANMRDQYRKGVSTTKVRTMDKTVIVTVIVSMDKTVEITLQLETFSTLHNYAMI